MPVSVIRTRAAGSAACTTGASPRTTAALASRASSTRTAFMRAASSPGHSRAGQRPARRPRSRRTMIEPGRWSGPPLEWVVVSTASLNEAQANAVAELLRIAPVAGRLGRLFADAGHELFLEGGSVRDALLGRLGHDLDFTTSARPDDIEALLRRFSPAVWTIGKEFGTVGCRVVDPETGTDWVIEVTTFRSDAYVA